MEKPSMIKYIEKRIKNNKNFLVTITGPTGSGKSWTALSIAEQLNEDFNIKRVIFKAEKLMEIVNSEEFKKRKGLVIVWDEAGIDLSNRNWQSVTNRMLNFLLQTFRHKNFILIFTAPYHDFLDVASRKLFHADFETVKINKKKGTCTIKPKLLQYNPSRKQWYRKYLRVLVPGIGTKKIKRWKIKKPSLKLRRAYENKKSIFTGYLNRNIQHALLRRKKDDPNPLQIVLKQKVLMEN